MRAESAHDATIGIEEPSGGGSGTGDLAPLGPQSHHQGPSDRGGLDAPSATFPDVNEHFHLHGARHLALRQHARCSAQRRDHGGIGSHPPVDGADGSSPDADADRGAPVTFGAAAGGPNDAPLHAGTAAPHHGGPAAPNDRDNQQHHGPNAAVEGGHLTGGAWAATESHLVQAPTQAEAHAAFPLVSFSRRSLVGEHGGARSSAMTLLHFLVDSYASAHPLLSQHQQTQLIEVCAYIGSLLSTQHALRLGDVARALQAAGELARILRHAPHDVRPGSAAPPWPLPGTLPDALRSYSTPADLSRTLQTVMRPACLGLFPRIHLDEAGVPTDAEARAAFDSLQPQSLGWIDPCGSALAPLPLLRSLLLRTLRLYMADGNPHATLRPLLLCSAWASTALYAGNSRATHGAPDWFRPNLGHPELSLHLLYAMRAAANLGRYACRLSTADLLVRPWPGPHSPPDPLTALPTPHALIAALTAVPGSGHGPTQVRAAGEALSPRLGPFAFGETPRLMVPASHAADTPEVTEALAQLALPPSAARAGALQAHAVLVRFLRAFISPATDAQDLAALARVGAYLGDQQRRLYARDVVPPAPCDDPCRLALAMHAVADLAAATNDCLTFTWPSDTGRAGSPALRQVGTQRDLLAAIEVDDEGAHYQDMWAHLLAPPPPSRPPPGGGGPEGPLERLRERLGPARLDPARPAPPRGAATVDGEGRPVPVDSFDSLPDLDDSDHDEPEHNLRQRVHNDGMDSATAAVVETLLGQFVAQVGDIRHRRRTNTFPEGYQCSGVCVAAIWCTADPRSRRRLLLRMDRLHMDESCLGPLDAFWATRNANAFPVALEVLQAEVPRVVIPSDWHRPLTVPSAVLEYRDRPIQEHILGLADPCNMLLQAAHTGTVADPSTLPGLDDASVDVVAARSILAWVHDPAQPPPSGGDAPLRSSDPAGWFGVMVWALLPAHSLAASPVIHSSRLDPRPFQTVANFFQLHGLHSPAQLCTLFRGGDSPPITPYTPPQR